MKFFFYKAPFFLKNYKPVLILYFNFFKPLSTLVNLVLYLENLLYPFYKSIKYYNASIPNLFLYNIVFARSSRTNLSSALVNSF